MAQRPKSGEKPDKHSENDHEREPIPFDDALRRLLNTPPKPKKTKSAKSKDRKSVK